MYALLLLAQAAGPAAAEPKRFSILAPVPTAPCRTRLPSDDIVICATAESSQRLPLPAERGPPNRPVAVNPNMDGMGALAATATPCASVQGGCQVGVNIFGAGTAAIRLIQKLVAPDSCCEAEGEATNPFKLIGDVAGGVTGAFKRKPAKGDRVLIDLSEPEPPAKAP